MSAVSEQVVNACIIIWDGLRAVIITCEYNSMHILGGTNGQKFGDVIVNHVIHTALHGAKQMMCQMWDVYHLVNNQVEILSSCWVSICNNCFLGRWCPFTLASIIDNLKRRILSIRVFYFVLH